MEIDTTLRVIILVGLLIGLSLLIYFELRYMRRRRNPKIDMQLVKDEAYNSIVTAKAVAKVLNERKRDISKAERLIFKAENAYSRGEYNNSKQLALEAKRELERSKVSEEETEENTFDKILSKRSDADQGEEEMENKTLFEEEKRLPENYLQSKFMIKNVERELERAVSAGKNAGNAMEFLEGARRHFDSGNYTEALKLACRADRCFTYTDTGFIDGMKVAKKDDAAGTEVTEENNEEATVEDSIIEESVMEAVKETICIECGSFVEEDDVFCGKCGSKVVKERKCPKCGALASEDDRFCRKCGTQLA
ncbi:MAG: zinc-ribbon domain-containing protein [Methanomassiliicoccales archaeon]|nr:zinc-ribbon domain-containing protein [Methanomassiliicoccales archaeon]